MKQIITVTLLSLLSMAVKSQATIEVKAVTLTPRMIAQATVNQEAFATWLSLVMEQTESHLKQESGNKDYKVFITLHKHGKATVAASARPLADEVVLKTLEERIAQIDAPKTAITDVSVVLTAKVNKGSDSKNEFSPAIVDPLEERLASFKQLDLAAKREALQKWIEDEVLPVAAHYLTPGDPKLEGMAAMAKIVEDKKYRSGGIATLTDKNSMYWNAMAEQGEKNTLVPFTKACMYLANGELDKASPLLQAVDYMSDTTTLAAAYRTELTVKLDMLEKDVEKVVSEGVALYDSASYPEAERHFEKHRRTLPNSAAFTYEYYRALYAQIPDSASRQNEWHKARDIIRNYDFTYAVPVKPKTPEEGFYDHVRREMAKLFRTKDSYRNDLVRFADFNLDIRNYALAAELYWLILNHYPPEDYGSRPLMTYYYYCLDKLGNKENVKKYPGDVRTDLFNLDLIIRERMENSPYYTTLDVKE